MIYDNFSSNQNQTKTKLKFPQTASTNILFFILSLLGNRRLPAQIKKKYIVLPV